MSLQPSMSTIIPTSSSYRTWFVYAPRNAAHEVILQAAPQASQGEWIDSEEISPDSLARQLPEACIVMVKFAQDLVASATEACHILAARRPDILLVAVGLGTDGGLVLAAMRAGAREYLDIGAPPEEIRNHLIQVMRQTRAADARGPAASTPRAVLVLMVGTRAGAGCSTLAAHFAVQAQERLAPPGEDGTGVLLLDLGRPAGDGYLNLGVGSTFHYDDALRDAERLDATLIRTVIAQHASKLRVLSQPADCTEPPRGGPAAMSLIERLRRHTSLIVVDLGGLPASQIPAPLLQAADKIWLVSSPDLASIMSLDRMLKRISPDSPRDARVGLIVNRNNEHTGIDPRQLATRFGLPLLAVLPDSQRGLRSSINQGRLLQEVQPRHGYLKAMQPLLAQAGLSAPAPASWLDRLRLTRRKRR